MLITFTSDMLMDFDNIESFLKGFHSIGSFTSGDKKSPVIFTHSEAQIGSLVYFDLRK